MGYNCDEITIRDDPDRSDNNMSERRRIQHDWEFDPDNDHRVNIYHASEHKIKIKIRFNHYYSDGRAIWMWSDNERIWEGVVY